MMSADAVIEPYFRIYKGEETNPYDEFSDMLSKRFWNLEMQWALFKDNEKYIDEALTLYSQEGLDDFCGDDGVPMEFKAYLMCRMVRSPKYIYEAKDFKKIYYELCYFNRDRFKYYKGESTNPFPKTSVKSNFWYGEMKFVATHQSMEQWVSKGKTVIEELENACEDEFVRKAKEYTAESFGILVYIKSLFTKWSPTIEWIFSY